MTELSSQFYSSGVDHPHSGPPWARVVVIDPTTNREALPGQTGMIRIIDLANIWSVLAIQTQDLAGSGSNGEFRLIGRDPNALPRGCSRAVDGDPRSMKFPEQVQAIADSGRRFRG